MRTGIKSMMVNFILLIDLSTPFEMFPSKYSSFFLTISINYDQEFGHKKPSPNQRDSRIKILYFREKYRIQFSKSLTKHQASCLMKMRRGFILIMERVLFRNNMRRRKRITLPKNN